MCFNLKITPSKASKISLGVVGRNKGGVKMEDLCQELKEIALQDNKLGAVVLLILTFTIFLITMHMT